jgi:hypothetical protein
MEAVFIFHAQPHSSDAGSHLFSIWLDYVKWDCVQPYCCGGGMTFFLKKRILLKIK